MKAGTLDLIASVKLMGAGFLVATLLARFTKREEVRA